MSQARGPVATGAGPGGGRLRVFGLARRASAALALAGLALALGGCGNCGGWTNPWYNAATPHSCRAEPGPEGSTYLLPGE